MMARGRKYFDDISNNFLIKQSNKIERVPNKVKFEARMIDDRIIQAQKFMKDDDLIDYENFKYFLFKIK